MSFIFSRALVAEFSPASFSGTDASAPSNTNPTPRPCLWHDRTMEPSRLSRFGMTCERLMDDRGAVLLMSWLAASRVRTSARLGGGNGIDGERSGLWREMARVVGEVRPRFVFVENSPLLVGRGLAVVLGDLADMGYDAQRFRLSASDCGAPHQRDRCWLVAHADGVRELQPQRGEREERGRAGNSGDETDLADGHGHGHGLQGMVSESQPRGHGRPTGLLGGAGVFPTWPADPADAPESRVGRVVDGLPHRAHRIKTLGNAQVPRVAATAFAALSGP